MMRKKNGQISNVIPVIQNIPATIIIIPKRSPKIDPPFGRPKHSSSTRFPTFSPHTSARLPNSSAPFSRRFSQFSSLGTFYAGTSSGCLPD